MQDYFFPYEAAMIYAGLKDRDQTFNWLRQACEEHHAWLAFFKAEPVFDTLRSDPRYHELLRRMHFAD